MSEITTDGFDGMFVTSVRLHAVERITGDEGGDFTTGDYRGEMDRRWREIAPDKPTPEMSVEMARVHLLSLGRWVREVAPDIWRYTPNPDQPTKED